MPSVTNVQRQMLARIAASANTITVVPQAARVVPTGTAPGPAPVNPLFGAPIPVTVTTPDPTPVTPPLTLKCLWYDLLGISDTRHNAAALTAQGWVADSDAVALVSLADATTATGTVFDTCDHVDVRGMHYAVLAVAPSGSAMALPYLCYVWLKGARKQ